MAILSRRWTIRDKAGASCSCGMRAERQSMDLGKVDWVCPKCGTRAPACMSTHGTTLCALVDEHQGDHESEAGYRWGHASPEAPAPVVQVLVDKRAVSDRLCNLARVADQARATGGNLGGLGTDLRQLAEEIVFGRLGDQSLAGIAVETTAAYQRGLAEGVAQERARVTGLLGDELATHIKEQAGWEMSAADLRQRLAEADEYAAEARHKVQSLNTAFHLVEGGMAIGKAGG